MLERKKIAAFIAGMLLCACTAAPAANAYAEDTTDSSAWGASPETSANEEKKEDKNTYTLSGDFLYSTTRDGTICIEDCKSTSAVLTIPEKLDGIAVTELGRQAFGSDPENNTFTEISLPSSINYISDENPFIYCTKLRSITVSEDNKDFFSEEGILYTKDRDRLVCYPCKKGGNSFKVPDSVKELGTSSLYNAGIKDITLPSGLEKIGAFALADLTEMESVDLSGTKVTELDPYAFSGCSVLKEIKLPITLEYIGGGAFAGCKELTEIELPQSLEEIGQYAFVNTGLTAVVIPDSVSNISYCAFGYYTDEDGNITANNSFTVVGSPNSAAHIYCTDSDSDYDYQNSFVFLTPEEYQEKQDLLALDRIKSGDFEYAMISTGAVLTFCTSTDSTITIPAEIDGNPITKIYPSCFTGTMAKEIIIPDTVEEIRELAFFNCSELKKVVVPASVKKIGNNAFDKCTALEYAEFCGAETVGSQVFCDCTSLKTFKAADTIKEWNDEEPFIYCTELEEIEIDGNSGIYRSENGVMYSNDMTVIIAYPANKADKSYTSPSGVKEVQQSAFANCKNLESVKLPDIEVINAYAFEGCNKLSSLVLSDKLTTLGSDALYDCTSLKSLRLPESLTDIGACAFGYYHNDNADTQNGEAADAVVEGFTLYAPKDCTAYSFAKSAGMKVVTGTTRFFGKNVSSGFVYSLAAILVAAVLAFAGILTGKTVKKKKAENAAAKRKAHSAELRRQRREAEDSTDKKEDDTIE